MRRKERGPLPRLEYRPSQKEEPYWNNFLESIRYLPETSQKRIEYMGIYMMDKFSRIENQVRDDGSPVSSHSIGAAQILADRNLPEEAIEIALLHDTPEDAGVDAVQLEQLFGHNIAIGVHRISLIKKDFSNKGEAERDAELRARLYEALRDFEMDPIAPYAVLARFAERLQNLRSIKARFSINPVSAIRTAHETMDVYVPLVRDLHLDEFADEMAYRSLHVLYPDIVPEIEEINTMGEILPVYISENRSRIASLLADAIGIDDFSRPDNIRIFYPDTELLTYLLDKGYSLQEINEKFLLELTLKVELVVPDEKKVWYWRGKLLDSEYLDTTPGSWRAYYRGLSTHSEPSKELIFTYKALTNDVTLRDTPFSIAVLTPDEFIKKHASLVDLYSLDLSTRFYKKAAFNNLRNLKDILFDTAMSMGDADQTRRDKIYQHALEGNLTHINIKIGNKILESQVEDVASILEAVAEVVREEDLLHLKYVKDERGNVINIYDPAGMYDLNSLEIEIDPQEIYARPGWFEALTRSDEFRREFFTRIFQQIMENNFSWGNIPEDVALKIRREILQEAYYRGRHKIIGKLFAEKYGTMLNLRVAEGFNVNLQNQYGDKQSYKFILDAGVEALDKKTIEEVVERIGTYRQSLIQIEIYVPIGHADDQGWIGVVSGFMQSRFNIKEFTAAGLDSENASALIVVLLELPHEKKQNRSEDYIAKSTAYVIQQIITKSMKNWNTKPAFRLTMPKDLGGESHVWPGGVMDKE